MVDWQKQYILILLQLMDLYRLINKLYFVCLYQSALISQVNSVFVHEGVPLGFILGPPLFVKMDDPAPPTVQK